MNATSAVSVAFDPLLGWTVLAVLGGIGLVLVLLGLRAGARGTWWRLGSLIVVLAALSNPSLVEEQRKPIADVALVVVDDSDSMAIGERRQQVQAARETLKRKLGQQEGLEVREAVLPPAHIQLGSERPGGTRLIETMRSALVEVPPERLAGVVLLTDGQVHDVPADLPPELGGAPLHALIAGKKNERDRLIVLEQSPRFGVVGREVTTKFRIEDPAGGTAPVTLSVGGNVVRRLDVPIGKSVELPITVGNPGANVVELEVAPGPNELTLDNNRALFTINGVRDRLRVLLVSGEPYQGERAWRNLLKSDPAVDLVHFTILRTPQKDDFTPVRELSLIVFPMRELFEQKLKEFDLIIFDRYESGGLITRDYFKNIANRDAKRGYRDDGVGLAHQSEAERPDDDACHQIGDDGGEPHHPRQGRADHRHCKQEQRQQQEAERTVRLRDVRAQNAAPHSGSMPASLIIFAVLDELHLDELAEFLRRARKRLEADIGDLRLDLAGRR